MKKKIAILFSMFYVVTAVGFAVNIHYCQGLFSSVSFFKDQGNCCCGNQQETSDCCKNETFVFQDNSKDKILDIPNISIKSPLTGIVNLFNPDLIPNEPIEKTKIYYTGFSPPKKQPIWLLNCTITVYG